MAAACNGTASSPHGRPGSAGAAEAGAGGVSNGDGAGGRTLAEDAGAAGASPVCDCGDNPSFVHVPLDCACKAGLCSTLDLSMQGNYDDLGWPYYVLFGTCASGYHQLRYYEACENGGHATYDAQGQLAYSSHGPYGTAPAVCGPNDSGFGDFGIGEEDPARDCHYCLVAFAGEGGASGNCISDQLASYDACDPNLFK